MLGVLNKLDVPSILSTMQLHDRFESIKAARDAITRFILDEGESFHVENQIRSDLPLFVRKDVVSRFWRPNPVSTSSLSPVLSHIHALLRSITIIHEPRQFSTL